MRRRVLWFSIPVIAAAILIAVFTVGQSVPQLLNYQGRLLDSGGHPLDGVTVDLTFNFYQSSPEGSLGEINIGPQTGTWFMPFGTSQPTNRVQMIYLASQLGTAGRIQSLSLEVTTIPGQVMNNFTIRMKHTTLSEYVAPASWEGSGWTTVYQKNETVNQTGWHTFTFTAPFQYDGTSNLMVDFSFYNTSFSSDGLVNILSTSGHNRNIYRRESGPSGHGTDPLAWSGTTPAPTLSQQIFKIRFSVFRSVMPSSPLLTVLQEGVLVTNGAYNVLIGSGQITAGLESTLADVFLKHNDVWMGVKVNSDPEMTPRTKISSVPYALGLDLRLLELFNNTPDWDGDGHQKKILFGGDDCNDADPDNWVTCTTCVDNDHDNWYVGCADYKVHLGPDCNDGNGAINPGAHDYTTDGIDQNCDGHDGCVSAGECPSGYCVDGNCCDTACNETCKACNISGHEGICSYSDRFAPDNQCNGVKWDEGACDGYCDGNGGCEYPNTEWWCQLDYPCYSQERCNNGDLETIPCEFDCMGGECYNPDPEHYCESYVDCYSNCPFPHQDVCIEETHNCWWW